MEVTRVQKNDDNSVYLLHRNENPKDTIQYRFWGKQTLINARIRGVQRVLDKRSFSERCQQNAELSKMKAKAQAIKVITLFLMHSPKKYKNKTALIRDLKEFADSRKILVSEKKLTEQLSTIRSLIE